MAAAADVDATTNFSLFMRFNACVRLCFLSLFVNSSCFVCVWHQQQCYTPSHQSVIHSRFMIRFRWQERHILFISKEIDVIIMHETYSTYTHIRTQAHTRTTKHKNQISFIKTRARCRRSTFLLLLLSFLIFSRTHFSGVYRPILSFTL